jgi:hypothetical protein
MQWERGGVAGAVPAPRAARIAKGRDALHVRVEGLPRGATCAVWAADPSSAATLSASYHTKGATERMPDADFENIAVGRADAAGRVELLLEDPMHGYSGPGYREKPHLHMRWWSGGRVSRTRTLEVKDEL